MKYTVTLVACLMVAGMIGCKPSGATEGETSTDSTLTAGTATGTAFNLDISRCRVSWSASKPTGTHNGIVPIQSGTFYMADGQITGGQIELNMAGIEVHDLEGEDRQNLEAHLRGTNLEKSDDFFQTVKYPTATFVLGQSASLAGDPAGTHLIQGDLRIKDITRPVSFKATVDATAGTAIKITTESFQIDRTQWDIRFKSRKFFDDLKDDFINDEITLQLEIGALQQP